MGCNTTSVTYGLGKTSLLKKINESNEIQEISFLISQCDATAEQVGNAGICHHLWWQTRRIFKQVKVLKVHGNDIICKTTLNPQKLPPTEKAVYFHSLRVHLKVTIWDKLTYDYLDPKLLGWKLEGSAFTPVMTDMNTAQDSLLKIIQYKYKLSSKNPCGSNICSCHKNGLKCVTACGDCTGDGCKNAEEIGTSEYTFDNFLHTDNYHNYHEYLCSQLFMV